MCEKVHLRLHPEAMRCAECGKLGADIAYEGKWYCDRCISSLLEARRKRGKESDE